MERAALTAAEPGPGTRAFSSLLLVLLPTVVASAGFLLWNWLPSPRGTGAQQATVFAGDARVHVPFGTRVTVEVLNATHVHGLARRATFYLRDRGFDVVSSGTTPDQRDTTIVIDRSHHADWAALVVRALGRARTEEQPDSSRDVDLTVLLGASWRPPAEPFYP